MDWGLCDLSFVPQVFQYICHSNEEKQESYLVNNVYRPDWDSFKGTNLLHKPSKSKFTSYKKEKNVNTLKKVLPEM